MDETREELESMYQHFAEVADGIDYDVREMEYDLARYVNEEQERIDARKKEAREWWAMAHDVMGRI